MIVFVEVDIIHMIIVRMIITITDTVKVIDDTIMHIAHCMAKGQGHRLGKAHATSTAMAEAVPMAVAMAKARAMAKPKSLANFNRE